MKSVSFFLLPFFFILLPTTALVSGGNEGEKKQVYIVYMGGAASQSQPRSVREDPAQLLYSVLKRNANKLLHRYQHAFSGFAARLSEAEARMIAQKPGVVSVFADPVLQLHTTRSWDFLQSETHPEKDSTPGSDSDSSPQGSNTIIAILDSGIWPESESFNDKGLGPVPSRWKGVCMEARNFKASNCNRKLIGARYYNKESSESDDQTPRDTVGHGTHTASTAAGSSVAGASYYGLAEGTAKGGSPGSRVAVYKVCTSERCSGSAILAAFDDAISDGPDVISLSLGASPILMPDFSTDPIAIGAFHAVERGITVVCSAGNDGPTPQTVVNAAPWILTVAATTIDRDLESDVVLGGNKVIKGEGINFSNLQKSPIYPLISGSSAKARSATDSDARNCNPDALDGKMVKGKIVVCENSDGTYTKKEKLAGVKSIGGVGLVLVDDEKRAIAFNYGPFPMTVITSKDADSILSYIKSRRKPVATILPTVTVSKYKPAPTVAYFSSRGPSFGTENLIKPDIAAPGVSILAAWIGNDSSQAPPGQKPSQFNVISGTSMSCPHVSGIAATVKSKNPTWGPSAIRSAIMTAAMQENSERAPLTTDSGSMATPFDYGSGEVSPSGSLQPGLVYETETNDYLLFLCNYGYGLSTIRLISSNIPAGFACPKNSNKDRISDLNYPSIAISNLKGGNNRKRKVSRTVTNVGEEESLYVATVKSAPGLDVKVVPNKLQFTKSNKKLTYHVTFSSTSSLKDNAFGSITWTNGKYRVQTVFAVSN